MSSPDVSGLSLLALVDDPHDRDTIGAYARHAGASIRFAADEDELATLVSSSRGDVIVPLALEGTDDTEQIRARLRDEGGRTCFSSLTSRRSAKLGWIDPDFYVAAGFPLLPSEFLHALAVLAGRESSYEWLDPETSLAPPGVRGVEAARAAHRMVLLVEDNEVNQEVITRPLQLSGFEAEVASQGREGLEKWRTGRFDLVPTDCHMPVMDGFETTVAIRDLELLNAGKRTPIIAVTANALHGEAEKCIAAGMDDYLSKPVALARLGEALKRWLVHDDDKADRSATG